MLPAVDPMLTSSWSKLKAHYYEISKQHMRALFVSDPARFARFSLKVGPLFLDYSKNCISEETIRLLIALAEEIELPAAREALFTGKHINATEDRAVLHHALRMPEGSSFYVDGVDVYQQVVEEREKMRAFCDKLHTGQLVGFSGKPIHTLVNIGIGGSDLGSRMICSALKPYQKRSIKLYFVSNLDASDILDTLDKCEPERTFFFVSSKSFRTAETMANARLARRWFLRAAKDTQHIATHFAAISTDKDQVAAFGIPTSRMFRFWDWVGGRFSLWSSVGLPIACAVGYSAFEELLSGAAQIDKHFLEAPLSQNMPTLLALLSLWHSNFFGYRSHAILCYAQHLQYFARFLQQMSMESNGKAVNRKGHRLNYCTAPVLWGEVGTNGQHSFHQLLHQGTEVIPCDFIAALQPEHNEKTMHRQLLSHCFAQSRGLMWGKTAEEVKSDELSKNEAETIRTLPYRVFEGNRPSNTILLPRLSPEALGALVALYEHKIFTEGILWNIYSFDQWGVEIGKTMAVNIDLALQDKMTTAIEDSSTAGLIEYTKQQGVYAD